MRQRCLRLDYMRQHCVSTLSHPDLVTDGYALGITLLMCLTGQPAVGLRDECRFILKFPDQRSKWKSTAALPDVAAGEWPEPVLVALAAVAAGLTEEFKDDRLPLDDALAKVASICPDGKDPSRGNELTLAPPHSTPPAPAPPVPTTKECIICEDAPRELRFPCGHASMCHACFEDMQRHAARKSAEAQDVALTDAQRQTATAAAILRCPNCSQALPIDYRPKPVGEAASAATFVNPATAARGGGSAGGGSAGDGSAGGAQGTRRGRGGRGKR